MAEIETLTLPNSSGSDVTYDLRDSTKLAHTNGQHTGSLYLKGTSTTTAGQAHITTSSTGTQLLSIVGNIPTGTISPSNPFKMMITTRQSNEEMYFGRYGNATQQLVIPVASSGYQPCIGSVGEGNQIATYTDVRNMSIYEHDQTVELSVSGGTLYLEQIDTGEPSVGLMIKAVNENDDYSLAYICTKQISLGMDTSVVGRYILDPYLDSGTDGTKAEFTLATREIVNARGMIRLSNNATSHLLYCPLNGKSLTFLFVACAASTTTLYIGPTATPSSSTGKASYPGGCFLTTPGRSSTSSLTSLPFYVASFGSTSSSYNGAITVAGTKYERDDSKGGPYYTVRVYTNLPCNVYAFPTYTSSAGATQTQQWDSLSSDFDPIS